MLSQGASDAEKSGTPAHPLLALLGLLRCVGKPVARHQRSATIDARAPSPNVAAREAQIDATYREIEEAFALTFTDQARQAIARSREEWDQRRASCTDEACWIASLDDQLNRARYALSQNARSVSGLPFRVGHLSIDRGGGYAVGALGLLPIIDNRILVFGNLAQFPEVRWTCEIQAEGQIAQSGTIEITTLDELRQRYRFEAPSARTLKISFLTDGIDRMCGMNGTLEGDYRVREAPITTGEPRS